MKCSYCNEGLSAGDISIIPKDKDLKEVDYKMVCPNCGKIQEKMVVFESDGMFFAVESK